MARERAGVWYPNHLGHTFTRGDGGYSKVLLEMSASGEGYSVDGFSLDARIRYHDTDTCPKCVADREADVSQTASTTEYRVVNETPEERITRLTRARDIVQAALDAAIAEREASEYTPARVFELMRELGAECKGFTLTPMGQFEWSACVDFGGDAWWSEKVYGRANTRVKAACLALQAAIKHAKAGRPAVDDS